MTDNRLGINWEITKKCNLNCVYCRVYGGKEKKGELSFQEAKCIVDKLHQCGYSHLKFTGGEPLIKDYFWDLVKYAHEKDMLTSVFTNSTLISKRVLPFFKKYISMVAISLDSLNEEHNMQLGRTKSTVVIDHIKELRKIGITVAISATVTKITLYDLSDLASKAKELGVSEIKINDFVSDGRAHDNLKALAFDTSFREVIPEIKKIIGKVFKEKITVENSFKCETDDRNLFINYKGDLYPCVELSYVSSKFKLGNFIIDDAEKMFSLNRNFYSQIQDDDLCAYSYFHSRHFSACVNRSQCPIRFMDYIKKARASIHEN